MVPGEPFRFETRIRFIDTDASGRIHYTAMFRYFEAAEIEFMRSLGVRYETQFGLPRVHVECDFLVELGYDDLIVIEVFLTKLGRSSIRLEFNGKKQGELAARGAVVVVCTDKKLKRAIPIPDEFRARLQTALSPGGDR
ncbi:MAG: acyl-CoA thioesterase [Acidobacteriaceae bacterium]|nr:acyl-CoA thioesterase [Acidobacteriaceae bacterium]MBV9500921.1 acyl-CoA thioesterase [Acidobacteriaceae bacterium]